jgi:hypothetical protein
VRAGTQQSQAVGTLRLEPGTHEVYVDPVEINGNELMRLRSITLTRAANETANQAKRVEVQFPSTRVISKASP